MKVGKSFFEVCKKRYGDRTRNVVVPGWSEKLFEVCWENLHLPCVWSFDRASWRTKDIICRENCTQKGCLATIEVRLPHQTSNLQISIEKYRSSITHDPKKKRRIQISQKEKLIKGLRIKSAFALRNELAAKMQDEQCPERPDLPTLNSLRLMKSRDQCPGSRNPYEALDELKNIHVNCIHKIGYDPFFAIYDTPAQSEYHLKETRKQDRSIISVDATGPGLKSPNSNPKCIFLYIICVKGNCVQTAQMSNIN